MTRDETARHCASPTPKGLRVVLGWCVVLSLVPCSGCLVGALHPVYDEEAIVFDEALLGTWENKESEVSVAVGRGEWRSYHIAYTDRFGTTEFTGHLTTVGRARFVNVRPEDGVERPAFLVALNGMLQVDVRPGELRVREPEYGVVLDRMKAGKLGLDAATDLKQNVVLTASTPTLRAWLAASVKDEALWADWKTLIRSPR